MKTEPEISIIIPCYNVPCAFIETALESVFAQTFEDYELIVVDDGSAQKFHDILAEVCTGDKVRLITQENQGVSAARNAGIQTARGKYIAFMDADDMITVDFLERAHDVALETDAELVIGGVVGVADLPVSEKVLRNGAVNYRSYGKTELEMLKEHFMGPQYLFRYKDGYISRGPVSRLIKAEKAKENLFDSNLTIGEDLVWNLQLLSACSSVCIVQETWYFYRENPDSATHRYNPDILDALADLDREIRNKIDLSNTAIYRSYCGKLYESIRLIYFLCLQHQKRLDSALYRRNLQVLYTQLPWKTVAEPRNFQLVSGKRKLLIMAYRIHILHWLLALKKG